jgi:hypothetical protein
MLRHLAKSRGQGRSLHGETRLPCHFFHGNMPAKQP